MAKNVVDPNQINCCFLGSILDEKKIDHKFWHFTIFSHGPAKLHRRRWLKSLNFSARNLPINMAKINQIYVRVSVRKMVIFAYKCFDTQKQS